MTLHEVIQDALEKRQAAYIKALVGGVKSHDEYRFLVGCLRGMVDFYNDIEKYVGDPDAIEDEDVRT